MKKNLLFILLFFVKNAFAQDFISNQLIVQVTDLQHFNRNENFYHLKKILSDDWAIALIEIDESKTNLDAATRYFLQQKWVRNVNKNYKAESRTTPNDPSYISQRNAMNRIKAPDVWNSIKGGLTSEGDTIVVAVVEANGFDYTHNDLLPNIWRNHTEIPNNGKDDDNNGYVDDFFGLNVKKGNDKHFIHQHGTAVLGIIGAKGNNSIGVSGINWTIKMMLLSEVMTFADAVECYAYAFKMRKLYNESNGKKGAFVVVSNSSFGFNGAKLSDATIFCNMYEELGKVGILNVAATANSPIDVELKDDIPSNCPSDYLLVVTNANRQDRLFSSAAFGKKSVDLAAPGDSSFTTRNDNMFDLFFGTSAATPHVAGAAALLYSTPSLDFIQEVKEKPAEMTLLMKKIIMDGVDKLPSFDQKTVSGGRLNIFKSSQILNEKYQKLPDFEFVNFGPNPAQNSLTVRITSNTFEKTRFLIYNTMGQLVVSQNLSPTSLEKNSYEIDLSFLPKGIYFLKGEKNQKALFLKKIVKM